MRQVLFGHLYTDLMVGSAIANISITERVDIICSSNVTNVDETIFRGANSCQRSHTDDPEAMAR